MITKTKIRQTYLENRNNFSKDYIAKATKQINIALEKTLLTHIKYHSIIGAYCSIGSEVDIRNTLIKLAAQDITLALPWIDYQKHIMNFKLWTYGDVLEKSEKFYCPQPQNHCKTCIPSIIITPLITCDFVGHRIGYGKGYYDKYLGQNYKKAPLVIGLCYDTNIYPDKIPNDLHDHKLDIIITDTKIIEIDDKV